MSATINFTGTRLDWIAMKGTATGTLPSGGHSVKIVRGTSSASGRYVTLDAVDIWGTISTGP